MTRKQTHHPFGRLRSLGLLLVSLVAVIAGAGPAAAAETIVGSGVGVGHSTIDVTGNPSAEIPCLMAPAGQEYIIEVAAGSVTAAEDTSAAEYAGGLTITIHLSNPFFFNPAGTFSDDECTMPAAVPATISVTDSAPNPLGGDVACPADNGLFQRVNTTIIFHEVGNDGDGSCTVQTMTASAPVEVSPVTHAFVGNEYPCLTPPMTTATTCPDGVEDVHVQGEWTVTGADTNNN